MKAIEKFANKETNCILCTNVLEEGIDLQLCNAVIMYDHPETFRFVKRIIFKWLSISKIYDKILDPTCNREEERVMMTANTWS